MSLYKKYRPKTLKEVVGQDNAVRLLGKFLANGLPHALMFTGPSGVGKTTIARILKKELECSDEDFMERNCADFRGVDDVRDIRKRSNFSPIGGKTRIWLLDEAHKMTNDAQNALLKILEDTPEHVYFFLASTDPQKIIKTIHTRCSQIKLGPVPHEKLYSLVCMTASKAKLLVDINSDTVIDAICEAADGSARKALVVLEAVGNLETEAEQLQAIQTTDFNKDEAINLARELLYGRDGWNGICKILRGLSEQDAEGIRYTILGYARAVLIGSKDGKPPNPKFGPKAYLIIDVFSRNFFDSKHAGLAAACWEILNAA
jgi:DNA polymerase III gamma/tau subunit